MPICAYVNCRGLTPFTPFHPFHPAAATQRGEKKDFYDIAAICDGEIGLADALALFRRKFGLSGSGHALMALTYFDDAEQGPDPVAFGGLTWTEVKRRIIAWTKEISRP